MTDLSICIVNYNTRDSLRRCLAWIAATGGNPPDDVDYLKAHPQVGALTCQMRFPDTGEIQRITSRVPRYADLLLETI